MKPTRKYAGSTFINANSQLTEKRFVRIYKEDVAKELWDKYCEGLGLTASDTADCIRLDITSAKLVGRKEQVQD